MILVATTGRPACAHPSRTPAVAGTPTAAALRVAFQQQGVDTIVLFSDGQPTDAKGADILTEVRTLNQTSGVVVNTVALGDYFAAEWGQFLRGLADQNGGEFLGL